MSTLIILRHVSVENANAIAGLTYGFPAITHFLGYTHALSRRLQQSHNLTLSGCGVICHRQQLHAYGSGWERSFALTRNPLTKEEKTAAFNEEGRMHMTVSLLMECHGVIADGDEGARALADHLSIHCANLRLAGGVITRIGKIDVVAFPQNEAQTRSVMRRLLPGYMLLDRRELLKNHFEQLKQGNPQAEMLDAWLNFVAIKMGAVANNDGNEQVDWRYLPKPESGYLVPLMTGYRAISPLYAAGEVEKTRDPTTPFCFAESIYGIGEWRGAHRIDDLHAALWRYCYHNGWYLCRSNSAVATETYEFNDDE
ncbi:type I-F CRISPR-associated protein Csy2 [Brenneria tiliae]|uniref:type I-F CRISPR-associated protein Csy2 n=1 Tax=Brenneria tiliae TaxID=2914984 RepID=UPI002014B925|nr:type I-F CRISPR-associated protein Csy2 [Brenneria tiliae]MCL2898995.1 type I-F CRISPR-associated protein Csy2 [Brenneria tiliae]MCL2903068.1 type I-F CRISPR-associated protein Csy2 [Brenneria tiliae]